MRKLLKGLAAFLNLINPKHWGPFAEISHLTKFDHAVSASWSQGGEDLALVHAFANLKSGRYIDVGAHHPDRFSVTRHLYQRGWSGINIEANPSLVEIFDRRRPRDLNLNFAVGTENSYSLTVFTESAISTIDQEWKEKFLEENNQIIDTLNVKGISLREIINEHFSDQQVDLLSIDAEGSDLNILESLNFETLDPSRYPKWLLLEASPPVDSALNTPSVKFAIQAGYEPYYVLPMSVLLKHQS